MRNKRLIGALFVLIVVLGFIVYLFYFKSKKVIPVNNPVINIDSPLVLLKDGRQCYTYNHEAIKTEPYAVNEFLDMTIKGNVVSGTKTGNQKGSDLTNGYSGTLTGTLSGDTITAVLSYIVEGSSGKEQEIYRARKDQTGVEKLRYPLIEKNKMLVPDITKEFKTMLYARVGCTASN